MGTISGEKERNKEEEEEEGANGEDDDDINAVPTMGTLGPPKEAWAADEEDDIHSMPVEGMNGRVSAYHTNSPRMPLPQQSEEDDDSEYIRIVGSDYDGAVVHEGRETATNTPDDGHDRVSHSFPRMTSNRGGLQHSMGRDGPTGTTVVSRGPVQEHHNPYQESTAYTLEDGNPTRAESLNRHHRPPQDGSRSSSIVASNDSPDVIVLPRHNAEAMHFQNPTFRPHSSSSASSLYLQDRELTDGMALPLDHVKESSTPRSLRQRNTDSFYSSRPSTSRGSSPTLHRSADDFHLPVYEKKSWRQRCRSGVRSPRVLICVLVLVLIPIFILMWTKLDSVERRSTDSDFDSDDVYTEFSLQDQRLLNLERGEGMLRDRVFEAERKLADYESRATKTFPFDIIGFPPTSKGCIALQTHVVPFPISIPNPERRATRVNYWADGGTLADADVLVLLPDEELRIIFLNITSHEVSTLDLPDEYLAAAFARRRWFGGFALGHGLVYGIPWSSATSIIVDARQKVVVSGATPDRDCLGSCYAGAAADAAGNIYLVPYSATTLPVIDPSGATLLHQISLGTPTAAGGQWYGAFRISTGDILFLPSSNSSIAIVTPINGTAGPTIDVTTLDTRSLGESKWRGGVMLPSGKIICIPYAEDDALIITVGASNRIHWTLMRIPHMERVQWAAGHFIHSINRVILLPIDPQTNNPVIGVMDPSLYSMTLMRLPAHEYTIQGGQVLAEFWGGGVVLHGSQLVWVPAFADFLFQATVSADFAGSEKCIINHFNPS